jgi:hypothetical protein
MKFTNSVKSSWKSCCSYAKKHYIMTFVMILVVILIVIYFNKNQVFENYVSQYADAKNRNVDITFSAKNNVRLTNRVDISQVTGYNSTTNLNTFKGSGQILTPLSTTPTNITGKSGDYGWVVTLLGSDNGNGTYNYNSTFIFDKKKVALDDANDRASVLSTHTNIVVNKSQNSQYVNIQNGSSKSFVTIKASNNKYNTFLISLKFI